MKPLPRVASCLLVLLLSASSLQAKEGFGLMKKLVSLRRINPPETLITGTRIQAIGKAQGRAEQQIATQIAAQLGSEMVQHDPRLSLDAQRPQTIVEVTVLQNAYETKWENRRETRSVEDGEDSKGKKKYRRVEVTVRYQVVNHRFGASYTVQDLEAKKTLFADSLNFAYQDDFEEGQNAPTEADRISLTVQQAVGQIVYKLTPTEEILQVLIPKGSFEDLGNLAEAGLWSRYSEAIEARPVLANPADEAYRQYALGVAFEALGYGADNPATTLQYLEQAAQHYNQALSLNPKEDFFSKPYVGSVLASVGKSSLNVFRTLGGGQAPVDAGRRQAPAPVPRVQEAMKKYQTILSQNEIVNAQAAGAKTLGNGAEKRAPQGMTNADVISMVTNGVPEEVVLGAIDQAAACAFDISSNGLIELAKAKVGKEVLKRMQAKSCS